MSLIPNIPKDHNFWGGVESSLKLSNLDSAVEKFRSITGATDLDSINDLALLLNGKGLKNEYSLTSFLPNQNYGTGSKAAQIGSLTNDEWTLLNGLPWSPNGLSFNGINQCAEIENFLGGKNKRIYRFHRIHEISEGFFPTIWGAGDDYELNDYYYSGTTSGSIRYAVYESYLSNNVGIANGNSYFHQAGDVYISMSPHEYIVGEQFIDKVSYLYPNDDIGAATDNFTIPTDYYTSSDYSFPITLGCSYENGVAAYFAEIVISATLVIETAKALTTEELKEIRTALKAL